MVLTPTSVYSFIVFVLEKAELTLISMLSKTKKVITTPPPVHCSVASRKLFYSTTQGVENLSLLFVPPTERRRNGDFYERLAKRISSQFALEILETRSHLPYCAVNGTFNGKTICHYRLPRFAASHALMNIHNSALARSADDYEKRKARDDEAKAAFRTELEKDDLASLYMRDMIHEEVQTNEPRLR